MAISEIVFISEISFLSGVLVASMPVSLIVISIAAIIFAAFIYVWAGNPKISFFMFIIFLIGAIYFNVYKDLHKSSIPLGANVSYVGTVSEEPKLSGNWLNVPVGTVDGDVVIRVSPLITIHYGDKVDFSGVTRFSNSGIPYISFPKIDAIEGNRETTFKKALYSFKDVLISPLKRFLSVDAAGLAAGMMLGVRSDFSAELKDAMQRSGTTHIVALSGYNISILIVAIGIMFRRLSKRDKAILAVVFIMMFVMMTGAEKSVVRAAIMGFMVLLAENKGRVYSPKYALTFAAFAMVLLDPRILAFDLGFELSFLSLLGVIFIFPKLQEKLRLDDSGALGWKENMLTTFSAQAAVAPLLLAKFGTISLVGLITNLLVLELVPLTMLATFIFSVISLLWPYVGFLFGNILEILLRVHLFIIRGGAALPYSSTDSWIAVALIYGFMWVVISNFNFRQWKNRLNSI